MPLRRAKLTVRTHVGRPWVVGSARALFWPHCWVRMGHPLFLRISPVASNGATIACFGAYLPLDKTASLLVGPYSSALACRPRSPALRLFPMSSYHPLHLDDAQPIAPSGDHAEMDD